MAGYQDDILKTGANSPGSANFQILPLDSSHSQSAASLYTDVFISDEPTTLLYDPDPSVFRSFADIYVRLLIQKNLSFVAMDNETRDIVGFIFCLDIASDIRDEDEDMARFLSLFHETVFLIGELERRYLDIDYLSAGRTLHIYQIGVRKKFRRSRIALSLVNMALKHGKELGYLKAVAECTSSASKQVFSASGFKQSGSIDYDSFYIDGVNFFSNINGCISLMTKDLVDQ